jgi:hypothetical protein
VRSSIERIGGGLRQPLPQHHIGGLPVVDAQFKVATAEALDPLQLGKGHVALVLDHLQNLLRQCALLHLSPPI